MKTVAATLDKIVAAAAEAAAGQGISSLTVGRVAERAGVSTALVHYHFDTKQLLLVAMAEHLARARIGRREGAFAGRKALHVLDALWEQVAADVTSGAECAWIELATLARTDQAIRAVLAAHRTAEREAVARRLAPLMRELGSSLALGAVETSLALCVMLDGAASALTAGDDAESVRAAYDAFWLALIAAGQAGRRR